MKSSLVALPLLAAVIVACSSSKTETIYENPPFNDGGVVIVPVGDGGGTTTNPDGSTGSTQCTSARQQALSPIGSVTTGAVSIAAAGPPIEIYVDATAGGFEAADTHPRTYIKFDGTKANIDDNAAFTSAAWDLALKRTDIYTNSGDAGPGQGGAVAVTKDFDAVTSADAQHVAAEQFFDVNCKEITDDAGFLNTTFEGWYDYDTTTNIPSAKPGVTFVVKSADGTLYKLQIVSNTGTAQGATNNPATANYLLKVAKL